MSRILVIEDDHNQAQNLKEVLEHSGYEVFCSQDLQETKDIIEQTEILPDLILCDLKLHHEDGFEILELVRKHVRLQKTFFIILSAYDGLRIPFKLTP